VGGRCFSSQLSALHTGCPSGCGRPPCGEHGQASIVCAALGGCTCWKGERGTGPPCRGADVVVVRGPATEANAAESEVVAAYDAARAVANRRHMRSHAWEMQPT